MKKSEAKWMNARKTAMDRIPSVCWEWADEANALINWDDLKRVYIVDDNEDYMKFDTVEALLGFCESELKEIKLAKWYNGLSDIEKAMLRTRGLVG